MLDRLRARIAKAIAPARSFMAAAYNRLTADWVFAATRSPDADNRELRTLRNRARDLVRNSPFGIRYQQLLAENIIGPDGIRLQAKNKTLEGKLFTKVNQSIEDAWAEWCLPENCDVTKRLSFDEMLALEVGSWGTDGEMLLRFLRGPQFGDYGLALQSLDPDLLDETLQRIGTDTLNAIKQGIEYNRWGVPVAYHVWNRYPDESQGGTRERLRISAEDVIHAFIPLRKGQSRGVPHPAAIMLTQKMLDGYLEAEVVAARTASAKMGAIEDADPANPAARDPNAGAAEVPLEADPGTLMDLRGTGGKLALWDPQHPTTASPAFTKMMSRFIAVGLGVSYGSLTGDMSDANYSSMKVGQQPERDHWKRYQKFVITHIVRRIYVEFLKAALLNKRIAGVTDYEITRYTRCQWRPRGFPSPDPLKDIQADLTEVDACTKTLTEICAERGRDFEEVVEERKQELELLAAAGVTSALPSSKAAAAKQDDEETDDSKDDTDEQDKEQPARARVRALA